MKTFTGINKSEFIKIVEGHRDQDKIIQGTYGENDGEKWQGCFIACSLRSLDMMQGEPLKIDYSSHFEIESRGLMPEWLARLSEAIFERLPAKDAPDFTVNFSRALPEGKDVSIVKHHFLAWLMSEVRQFTQREDVIAAIDRVKDLHTRAANGDMPTHKEWDEAAYAAADAVYAYDAAAYAAADAAYAAADAAAVYAYDAADAYDADAYDADAYAAAFVEKMATKLIEILEGQK